MSTPDRDTLPPTSGATRPGNACAATGLILAGGAGRRLGGVDKGLQHWRGEPLVVHVARRLAPQVDHMLLSCNRNHEHYAGIAGKTVTDLRPGLPGPLAGLEAAIPFINTPLVIVVPCDIPLMPPDLVRRLVAELPENPASVSFPFDGNRAHYLPAAIRSDCLARLNDFLSGGGSAVREFYALFEQREVDFSDCPEAFLNVNTERELRL